MIIQDLYFAGQYLLIDFLSRPHVALLELHGTHNTSLSVASLADFVKASSLFSVSISAVTLSEYCCRIRRTEGRWCAIRGKGRRRPASVMYSLSFRTTVLSTAGMCRRSWKQGTGQVNPGRVGDRTSQPITRLEADVIYCWLLSSQAHLHTNFNGCRRAILFPLLD